MTPEYARVMARYNRWMNDNADRVWWGRFTGAELKEGELGPGGIRALDQELYADFDELRSERKKTSSITRPIIAAR